MTVVPFDYDKVNWTELFNQSGRGFVGVPYQRGRGLGSAIHAIRYLIPAFLRSTVGQELVQSGQDIVQSIASGTKPAEAVRRRGRQAIRNLVGVGKHKTISKRRKRSFFLTAQ